MDNIDEFLKQGRERRQQYIDELREANPIEPVIIEGRPFTPDDLQHLDELNEEMLKQNPPKPYQWKKGMLSHIEWEEMYLQRPIILDTPPMKKPKNNPPIQKPKPMKIEARITEVSVPTNDQYVCKIAHKVEYRAIDYDGKKTRWLFHSIHQDIDLANYVKAGIEDNSISVIFELPR